MTAQVGGPSTILDADQVSSFIAAQLGRVDLDGRSLCLVIPDGTRKFPLDAALRAVGGAVAGRVSSCTAVVALGTHPPLTGAELRSLAGSCPFPIVNHEWWDDRTFAEVGLLSAESIVSLSGGRIEEDVEVRVNRLVVESDVTVILGPVLPHEVVGFSGGHKYLFPGLSGQELIDLTHWLGALISSREIIGVPGITPVRAVIEAASDLVPGERYALCGVVDGSGDSLRSLAFGEPRSSWAAAAGVAARTHVRHLAEPVPRVLSLVARRYHDLWTGAKGFYKVEPVVADGGEVVLYAPHITDISVVHPAIVDIGYHCRDFYLAQWDLYKHVPRGDLAHSTHLFGAGTYDPVAGERGRVRVTLATGIPEEVVRRVNLGYLAPGDVDIDAWRADTDALVVDDAGEVLYRLG